MHKSEYKDYVMSEGGKDKKRDQVLGKFKRRFTTDQIVKRNLTIWGKSYGEKRNLNIPNIVSMLAVKDGKDVLILMFVFVAMFDDEEITLDDFK